MSIYLIVLDEPDADAWKRLKAKWPKRNLVLSDRTALVSPEEIILTEDI